MLPPLFATAARAAHQNLENDPFQGIKKKINSKGLDYLLNHFPTILQVPKFLRSDNPNWSSVKWQLGLVAFRCLTTATFDSVVSPARP